VSTAAFSEIAVSWYPRETEASILAQLLRLSRLTVLYGEAGAGKTALLKNGVLPQLRRRASDRDFTAAPASAKELPFPDRRQIHPVAERAPEVAIFFDEWNEAPLAALEARMRGALRARRPRTAEPAASMAKSLRAWNKESGVRFLIIFDAFDEYLAASRDAPGIRKFGAEFVEVLKDDRLPANFLLALRDERPLVERFEGRIACLGDTSVRLPSWHRFVGSLDETQHRAGPPAAAAPDLGDATAPALRPIPDSGLHTITGAATYLGEGSSVLKAAPKCELQTDRATPEVGESPSPVLEVIAESNSHSAPVAFELVQPPSPAVTAELESNSPTAPRVSEVADRATSEVGESAPPVLEVIAFDLVQSPSPVVTAEPESNSRTAPEVSEVADRANAVRRHWGVKLAWLALPLIGIALLLIVLTPPKPPSQVANVQTNPKPPSQVVNVPTNPKPASDVTRTPAATERSTAVVTAGGASEIARLTARANALLAQGDIASARIVLERAVDLGSAKAAFALAETYDPIVLDAWRTFGTLGDVARAKQLYAKAKAGGVQEAQGRLNALRE
jgi:conflict system STAND superfamily ATPase